MNIDERIEALTQSVELLASMHQDLEKKWDGRMARMLELLESMTRMIEIHEKRLDGHDRRIDDLEH